MTDTPIEIAIWHVKYLIKAGKQKRLQDEITSYCKVASTIRNCKDMMNGKGY